MTLDKEFERRVFARAKDLVAWAVENDRPLYPGNRVNESTAAEILVRSPGTLKNWRSAGTGPAWISGSRVTYDILDLARAIESGKSFT